MRKTDIPETLNFNWANGQRIKNQVVTTPYGNIWVDGAVRVPSLKASKRCWNLWFKRFVIIRMDDPTSALTWLNRIQYPDTIEKYDLGNLTSKVNKIKKSEQTR